MILTNYINFLLYPVMFRLYDSDGNGILDASVSNFTHQNDYFISFAFTPSPAEFFGTVFYLFEAKIVNAITSLK